MASIEDRVRAIIAEQLDQDESEIVPEANFIEDLGADSLDLVELVMRMEDEFDVEIPDDEAENIRLVQDAINYIQQHLASSD
ncbi:MAG: acyl carrier protein [Myxococcales bacterium]|nr:acyl carrier protein [Myxococcales bacterium]|tara:strand:- start:355 stop:600 length:246 start_codon:yes stop_codon:yes gene_type:complete